jgi:hypothetical protein
MAALQMLRLIALWLANLFGSALAAVAGYAAVREITHSPADSRIAFLGGLVPITSVKSPWLIALLVTLAALWLVVHLKGGRHGAVWGLWIWSLQVGISWSIAALLLFAGILLYGLSERSLWDLNWRFSLGYLAAAVILLAACLSGWRITNRRKAAG